MTNDVMKLTSWSYSCSQLQQHGLLRVKKSKHPLQISTSERKILIVLCYYILLSVVALTGVTIPLRNAQLLTVALIEYWQCEAAGVDPLCNRPRTSFEEQTNPGIITVSYMLLWIFPAVNLIFAVNVSELKQKFKTWRGQAALLQNTSYKASNETEWVCNTLELPLCLLMIFRVLYTINCSKTYTGEQQTLILTNWVYSYVTCQMVSISKFTMWTISITDEVTMHTSR